MAKKRPGVVDGRRVAIVDGLRTPFAKSGTAFKDVSTLGLAQSVVTELLIQVAPPSNEKYMPEAPTPLVKGQVVGSPAAQASISMLSLAPAANTVGLLGSTAIQGSFCLFCEKGVAGLPLATSVSPGLAATGNTIARMAIKDTSIVNFFMVRLSPLVRLIFVFC